MTELKNGCVQPSSKATHSKRMLASDVPPCVRDALTRATKTLNPDDCWEWQGYRTANGYGRSVHIFVHRAVYALVHGEAPAGMVVRHSCDNPPCFNPRHLLCGTARDNSGDWIERGITKWTGKTREERRAMNAHSRRGVHPSEKPIIGPDGRRYISARAASEETGIKFSTLSWRCINQCKGWRFV
jgi:hypothetical protein